LIDWLSSSSLQKFVYISSTSVYGQKNAGPVTEESPTEPESDTGRIVVETEQLLLEAARQQGFPAVVLRAAGIYGPDRGYLFQQYLKDEVKITGDPNRYLNMIHRDDLVGIIITALQHGRPGQVYNAVDNEPVPQIAFFRWLSKVLGKGMPPYAYDSENHRSKRGVTNKQVINKKMKTDFGYQLKYPTFREGFTAEIERLREER
jgi:nucleoside-diphosphate-sugar epimerase